MQILYKKEKRIKNFNLKNKKRLGLILGAKIFIDFAKYSFEDAMEKLKHELRQHLNEIERKPPIANNHARSFEKQTTNNKNLATFYSASDLSKQQQLQPHSNESTKPETHQSTSSAPQSNGSQSSPSVSEWTKQDVHEWLAKIELSDKLSQSMANFDGEMLCELNSIRLHASSFFYESLGREHRLSLAEIVTLSKEMRKLFD
mgnify:CR=1 FL=1